MMTPKIHIAFRFHGNFYHSYRGDTADELGFGKDIRIIRHLIDSLDELNKRGIAVCGTWDFENYFSLQELMPVHCPDIIANLKRRVTAGFDEMQLMSYNNGLVGAHTAKEFEAAIQRAISNIQGSGLDDLFGKRVHRMVRPQEMMFTPIHLKLYPAYGINRISLYYSALPFNGFSNFIPPLSFIARYNPLLLTYPGIEESMTLMPCYNVGDLADHLGLKRWVKKIRRTQLKMDQPQDVLLLIDMDADDEFWVGFNNPLIRQVFPSFGGFTRLIESIADLEYIEFTTPDRYLDNHAPVEEVSFGQDTADGSFDGYASWAEKWSNQRLWTGLDRARILEAQTQWLNKGDLPPEIQALLDQSFEARLKILSTTHFGMSAPVMNLSREMAARNLVTEAVSTAEAAFVQARPLVTSGTFSLLDYVRGDSSSALKYQAHTSRALIRLPLRENAPDEVELRSINGIPVPHTVIPGLTAKELFFIESFEPEEKKTYQINPGKPVRSGSSSIVCNTTVMENDFLQVKFNTSGELIRLNFRGEAFSTENLLTSRVTYAGESYQVVKWDLIESQDAGILGIKRMSAQLDIPGGNPVRFWREIIIAAGLPYLYIQMHVQYPLTPFHKYNRKKAERLQQAWDNRWEEVCPCAVNPAIIGSPENPLHVWKHNYFDHVSNYSLDYSRFSRNESLDSVNNQVTFDWVAVSNGSQGVLLAQTADVNTSMAFCPMRVRKTGEESSIQLNPFGSYWGKQYYYATADTGLGKLLDTIFSASDHLKPYAPSYNGRTQEFSLILAPYRGDKPPQEIQDDACAFAYPYLVLNDENFIDTPSHRSWDGAGLGTAAVMKRS